MAEVSSPPAVIEIEEIDLNPIAEGSGSSEPPVNNQNENGNRKKLKWTDRIRNWFSWNHGADNNVSNNTRDGSADVSTKPLMNLDGINEKKTIANGLMDFAFLTANANQLHSAVNSSNESGERTTSIVLISISIFIQIIVGILLIASSYIQYKPNVPSNNQNQSINNQGEDGQHQPAKRIESHLLVRLHFINHLSIGLVFLVAIINIFIASFTIRQSSSSTDNNNVIL